MRLLCAMLLALLLASPAQAQVWRKVEKVYAHDVQIVRGPGAVVRIERHWQGEGDDRQPELAVVVQMPGLAPYTVAKDEAREDIYGLRVGIGKLSKTDARPVVIVEGYSGGAHCCVTFQLVTAVGDNLRTLPLDWADGDFDARFPRDIDGDGVVDIQRSDDSFLYAFTSYAGSWILPKVYNLRGGELVEVTREPRFAPLFRQFAARTLAPCRKPDELGRGGPCAAYAGAMARLGQAEEGIRTAVANSGEPEWYPSDCLVPTVEDTCPEGKEREFANFEQALRWFLKEHDYID